ncbi:WD40 repeat domain-containing serine/threonine protein kinase [Saccharopolyspora soli]|uniref:WD40 repeat domain-containing serine/threonine protein kinase n=1 Tax=Saccharopolyspora soli TaxID=2926618 RepID=UPI00241312A0|nr:serine/threonine-protein kinase [Saccharopolyspora soli]
MSEPGAGPPAVPPTTTAAGPQELWTVPPPRRPLKPTDPATIGRYQLEAVLGEGGMGRVYLGHTPAGSSVAIKVVHREYAADWSFRRRFEQEVAAAKLVHGLYTVPVVDADVQADEPWLATAYIPGPSLQYAVAEYGPLPVDATLALLARVAEALESIHAAGVIHRDLKPSNVILTAEGPKVIDFGIARAAEASSVTGTDVRPGTPAYMAPEYILGQTLTPAVDVFALGVVANFAATGELAFGGGSGHAVVHRILEQDPNLDGCPEPVRGIAAACLTKDPQQRPAPSEVIDLCRQPATISDVPGAGSRPATPTQRDTADETTAPAAATPPGTRQYTQLPHTRQYTHTPHLQTTARPWRLGRLLLIIGAAAAASIGILLGIFALLTTGPSFYLADTLYASTPGESSTEAISSVAFSPDGEILASARGGNLELWDVPGREQRVTLTNEDSRTANHVAFSPDGQTLAAARVDGKVELWDVPGREQRATLTGHTEALNDLAFSPDGRTVASAGADSRVRLWDVASSQELAMLTGHTEAVNGVAFSPDGQLLATASEDGTVRLWDVATREQRATLTGKFRVPVVRVAFSPDGKLLAAADQYGKVALWDVATREQRTTLADDTAERHGDVNGMAFSPDSELLVTVGDDGKVELWNVTNGLKDTSETSPEPSGQNTDYSYDYSVNDVAFSPDGQLFATAGYGGTVSLWQVRK